MKSLWNLEENTLLSFLIIISFILTLLIPTIRMQDMDPIPDYSSYYHLRLSRDWSPIFNDTLMQRDIPTNAYHFFLNIISRSFDMYNAMALLNSTLASASLVFFYLIMRELKIIKRQRIISCAIIMCSPLFYFTSSIASPSMLGVATLLGTLFCLLRKQITIAIFTAIIFLTLGQKEAILLMLILMALYLRDYNKKILAFIIGVGLVAIFMQNNTVNAVFEHSLINFISDLGGLNGLGIFMILLSFVGFISLWKYKRELLLIYASIIYLLINFFTGTPHLNIYLVYILSLFAGFAILSFLSVTWQIKIIKDLTILVIICGLLFSSISLIGRVSTMAPHGTHIKSLEWLKANSNPNEKVFSHFSRGFLIQYAAQRPTLTDYITRNNDEEIIFNSQQFSKTHDILKDNKIRYIWIDYSLRKDIWNNEDKDLLYLFQNEEGFKKEYGLYSINIYQVLD